MHLAIKTAHIASRHTLLLLSFPGQFVPYPLLIGSLSLPLRPSGHIPGEVGDGEDDGDGDDGEDGPEGDGAGVGAAGDVVGDDGVTFGGVGHGHLAVSRGDTGGH